MSARLLFAAVVAAFARPQFNDAPRLASPAARLAEDNGIVSPSSAARIVAAFKRFSHLIGGGR